MDWNSSLLWGIIGLVGGFLISLLFFTLSKKQRKLSYSISTTPIIIKKITKISGLAITYKNQSIDNLSTSYLKIKNIGNDTLELTDFPELNKLSITTSGVFLINSTNELEITKSNKFMKMEPSLISSNKIELSFDYFDPKNEISFSIFHTGDIKVCGSIKNGKIINDTQIEKIIHYKTMLKEYIPIILLIICAIFYGINIYLNTK
jgi:hypothetical protein